MNGNILFRIAPYVMCRGPLFHDIVIDTANLIRTRSPTSKFKPIGSFGELFN